jgi:hypothetical protein
MANRCVSSLRAINFRVALHFVDMTVSQVLGAALKIYKPSHCTPRITHSAVVIFHLLQQTMSSDENSAPTIGEKRQGALQLGPRKKPCVFIPYRL